MSESLSQRERECLIYAASGATNLVIGRILFISVASVVRYLEQARRKLNAKNTTHAVAIAIREGLI